MAAPPSFGPEDVRRPVFRYAAGRAIVGAAASLSVRFATAIWQATELRAEMPLAWVAISQAARDQMRKARLAACRQRAYIGLATTLGRENGDGQGPEEDQPRGQEAQGRQEEARPAARHRGERVRQAEDRRAGGGEAEVGARPQGQPSRLI